MEQQRTIVTWSVVSIILSIVMITNNTAPAVLGASFMAKSFAFLLGTIFGVIGTMVGDAIRKFAAPESFFTTGGMGSILKTKIFWMIGPQSIGVFVGVALGISLTLN